MPRDLPRPGADEVHVWWAAAPAPGALCDVLSGYMGVGPESLGLVRGVLGKPELAEASPDLRFSLARTRGAEVIAVTAGPAIGVDVERCMTGARADALAHRVLDVAERRVFERTSPDRRAELMTVAWTRKEALVKATGEGLRRWPSAYDAGLSGLVRRRRVAADGRTCEWWVTPLEAPEPFVAALASEGRPLHTLSRWWTAPRSPRRPTAEVYAGGPGIPGHAHL